METKQNEIETSSQTLPRNEIFTHPLEQRFLNWYRSFFSIAEIENTPILHWLFGALLLTYFVTFFQWGQGYDITIEANKAGIFRCWSYFQSCGDYYFLHNLPYGYSQPILYVLLFGVMTLIVYLMWRKDWVLAHVLLWIPFLWKFVVMTFLTSNISGNFDYFDIAYTVILLLLPHKLFFLKIMLVSFYFLAATIKFDAGWVLGTYFTALNTGLPLFPNNTAPIFTNIVIGMQVVGTWFLLSSKKILRRGALIFFLCFHLYSGIIVHYRYLTTAIPSLLILFGPMYTQTKIPLDKKSIGGWAFICCLFFLQFVPFMISGDHKMTLEGNRLGLYMFEANHQCVSKSVITFTDGRIVSQEAESATARQRCDPYKSWFRLKLQCERYIDVDHISWTFDHSINGGPFYRIVDVPDACAIEYKPFIHNEWIKLPKDKPELIGYPVKNLYY